MHIIFFIIMKYTQYILERFALLPISNIWRNEIIKIVQLIFQGNKKNLNQFSSIKPQGNMIYIFYRA